MIHPAQVDAQRPSRAGSLPRVGGALAFDFANTASGRGTPSAQEHLRTVADLLAWSVGAELLTGPEADAIRPAAGDPVWSSALRDARALRDAVHALASALAEGADAPAASLDVLRVAAGRATLSGRLARTADGRFAWRWSREAPAPNSLLGPVALSAVDVLRQADPRRIKRCPGEGCGWVFLDETKNMSRRWCEMAVCGNRHKARRFASRNAEEP